jgi:hypothetical protein
MFPLAEREDYVGARRAAEAPLRKKLDPAIVSPAASSGEDPPPGSFFEKTSIFPGILVRFLPVSVT